MSSLADPSRSRIRYLIGGLVLALAVGSSCGGGSAEPDQLAYRITSESAVEQAGADEDSDDAAAWSPLEAQLGPGAAQRFDTALAAIGDRYRFESRLGTESGDTVELSGHRIGQSATYRLTAGGATVEVVDLGGAVWTRVADGPWESTDDGSGEDPLKQLSQPIAVIDGTGSETLVATYAPETLGFDGSEPLAVTVLLAETITFTTTTPDGLMLVSALTPDTTLPAIEAPNPAG
jgi:hypothetical protein